MPFDICQHHAHFCQTLHVFTTVRIELVETLKTTVHDITLFFWRESYFCGGLW